MGDSGVGAGGRRGGEKTTGAGSGTGMGGVPAGADEDIELGEGIGVDVGSGIQAHLPLAPSVVGGGGGVGGVKCT